MRIPGAVAFLLRQDVVPPASDFRLTRLPKPCPVLTLACLRARDTSENGFTLTAGSDDVKGEDWRGRALFRRILGGMHKTGTGGKSRNLLPFRRLSGQSAAGRVTGSAGEDVSPAFASYRERTGGRTPAGGLSARGRCFGRGASGGRKRMGPRIARANRLSRREAVRWRRRAGT